MRAPGHDGAADRGGDRPTAEDDKTASPQDDRPAPYSWDLLTVEHAINDNCPHYKLSAPGHVRFNEKGRTVWTPDAQGGDRYVIWAQPSEKIETDINALLCAAE